ncbi:MAG: TlpA family protein disulfide reductase [Chloroflexi bacterium]|nr:TlpA family protein disulfide reductase [Chloroflexota bacterium]
MSKQKYRKQRIRKRNLSTVLGAGLLILGAASFLLLIQNESSLAAASENEPSVTPMEVNFPAPPLALKNLDGETQSLADFRGKVVLVNNWATWCPPCKAEMPSLKKYHDKHTAEGFTVIAVEAGDKYDEALAFAQSLDLTFPVWLDPQGAALRAFGNGSLPNSYVIDGNGTVRLAWTGQISLAMLEKYVTPIIQTGN